MIHPRMATMLAVLLTDAARRPRRRCGPAAGRRGADLEPALRRRRHEHQRHRLPARLGRRGGRAGAGRQPGRASRCGGPSRRSRATSRASRPPTARAPRRSSPWPGERAPATTPRLARSRGPSCRGAWSRPRSTGAIPTGAACGRRRERAPGRCGGARGGRPARGGGDGRAGRPRGRSRPLRIAIAGQTVFDGAAGGPLGLRASRDTGRDGRAGGAHPARSRAGHGRGEAFGCDLTEAYVLENAEYTT